MPLIFSNVKSIYKLHHDFLLPQLEERMAQWEANKRIGTYIIIYTGCNTPSTQRTGITTPNLFISG